jgi:hypothetical protein
VNVEKWGRKKCFVKRCQLPFEIFHFSDVNYACDEWQFWNKNYQLESWSVFPYFFSFIVDSCGRFDDKIFCLFI